MVERKISKRDSVDNIHAKIVLLRDQRQRRPFSRSANCVSYKPKSQPRRMDVLDPSASMLLEQSPAGSTSE